MVSPTNSLHQTSLTDRSTEPVEGKTVEAQKTERMAQKIERDAQKTEDRQAGNGSEAPGEAGLNPASNSGGEEGFTVGGAQGGGRLQEDQGGSKDDGCKCSCVVM